MLLIYSRGGVQGRRRFGKPGNGHDHDRDYVDDDDYEEKETARVRERNNGDAK